MTKLLVLLVLATCSARNVASAGETITARELESYFYDDRGMKRDAGQYEITYYVDGDTVTRTRVYDIKKRRVIPDDTVYRIQRQLWSDPTRRVSLRPTMVRAIGEPGGDAIEILVIGRRYIKSVKSTSDYVVITKMRRID